MSLTVMSDGSERIHYADPSIPLYLSRGNLLEFPEMAALCHWHEDIELLMPLEGYLSYNVGGQIVEIAEGNAIFVNSRQMHFGFSADGTDCWYLCVTFRPQLLCANEEIRVRFLEPVLSDAGLPYILLEKENPAHVPLLDILRRIEGVRWQGLSGREMLTLGYLYALWNGIFELLEPDAVPSGGPDMNTQRRMLEYIRTHFSQRLTLDMIAASGGICRSKCCRLFKKYLARSPNDYLTSFRLERASELLRETDLSVTEIAYDCGFGSGSYFAELFLRHKGCSPTEYRKKTG